MKKIKTSFNCNKNSKTTSFNIKLSMKFYIYKMTITKKKILIKVFFLFLKLQSLDQMIIKYWINFLVTTHL
jgi:hypothetical protein